MFSVSLCQIFSDFSSPLSCESYLCHRSCVHIGSDVELLLHFLRVFYFLSRQSRSFSVVASVSVLMFLLTVVHDSEYCQVDVQDEEVLLPCPCRLSASSQFGRDTARCKSSPSRSHKCFRCSTDGEKTWEEHTMDSRNANRWTRVSVVRGWRLLAHRSSNSSTPDIWRWADDDVAVI